MKRVQEHCLFTSLYVPLGHPTWIADHRWFFECYPWHNDFHQPFADQSRTLK